WRRGTPAYATGCRPGQCHAPLRRWWLSGPIVIGRRRRGCKLVGMCQDRCRNTSAIASKFLSDGTGDATRFSLIGMNQAEQNGVRRISGKLGIDASGKGLHGNARGRRPFAMDLPLIAPDPFELA